MRWSPASVALSLCLLTGCAAAPVEEFRPAEISAPAPAAELRARLLAVVIARGYSVTRETQSTLVVDKPSDNLAANVLLGSRMRPQVNARVTFTFIESAGRTRVVTELVIVTNPGTGLEQLTPIRLQSEIRTVQGWLDQAAAPKA